MTLDQQLKPEASLPLADTLVAIPDSIELLRQILTKEQHREIAYDEAAVIGESLLEFFEVLAEAS